MNPPGRFLEKNSNGDWEDVTDSMGRGKASQALRDAVKEYEDERYHSDNILFGGGDNSLFGGFSPPSLASDMHDAGASDHETSTPITPQTNDILMGRGGTSILSL